MCLCLISMPVHGWISLFQTQMGGKYHMDVIYVFGVLHRFQHCTGHITTGSWKGRGNQYIQFVRVLYCKLPTNGKQLLAFPLEAVPGTKAQPQRWEARAYGRNSRKYKCEEINLACSGYLFKIIIFYFFCRIFLQ